MLSIAPNRLQLYAPRLVNGAALIAAALIVMLNGCVSAYAQRLDKCVDRLERDRPELTASARQKSCATEVGPAYGAGEGLVPAPVN